MALQQRYFNFSILVSHSKAWNNFTKAEHIQGAEYTHKIAQTKSLVLKKAGDISTLMVTNLPNHVIKGRQKPNLMLSQHSLD